MSQEMPSSPTQVSSGSQGKTVDAKADTSRATDSCCELLWYHGPYALIIPELEEMYARIGWNVGLAPVPTILMAILVIGILASGIS